MQGRASSGHTVSQKQSKVLESQILIKRELASSHSPAVAHLIFARFILSYLFVPLLTTARSRIANRFSTTLPSALLVRVALNQSKRWFF